MKSLSVFFPAYNEEANIAKTVEDALATCKKLGLESFEIIVVDDGSSDKTPVVADELDQKHAEVRVVHQPNQGYGGALKSGFKAATKDWVVFTDSDGQFDFADIELMLPLTTDQDVILGYRRNRQDNALRKLNAGMWGSLMKLMFGFKVRDIDCAFKLISAQSLMQIKPLEADGAFISTELIVKLVRSGARIAEVGVQHKPRLHGEPTGADPKVILRAFKEMLALRRQI